MSLQPTNCKLKREQRFVIYNRGNYSHCIIRTSLTMKLVGDVSGELFIDCDIEIGPTICIK